MINIFKTVMITFKQFLAELKEKKLEKLKKKADKLQKKTGKLSKSEVMTILNAQGGIGRKAVERVHGKQVD